MEPPGEEAREAQGGAAGLCVLSWGLEALPSRVLDPCLPLKADADL